MKVLFAVGAVIFLASQFLYQAYAIELCEARDYYNLANSTKCKIKDNKADNKGDSSELVFEILKNYPYEEKGKFAELLQRKIELLDKHTKKQRELRQSEKVKTNIRKLEQTKQNLAEELIMVNSATRDNWVRVRDQARRELKEAAKRLREV